MASISVIRHKFFWLIIISVVAITAMEYFGLWTSSLHELYRELYYFPLFVAGMRYGIRGAIITLAAIYSVYILHILLTWQGSWQQEIPRILELLFYLLFAVGAGYLSDREKRIRGKLERNRLVISLGRITSGIVHDLKNPLISIIGLLERLARGKGDCSRYVPVMLQDAYRMERIVYDVLDFARPVNLKKERCNLADVVKNAEKMCGEKAEKAKVSLNTELDEIYTEADPFLLERALVNVISNAVEASKAGDTVHVMLKKRGTSALVTVKDDGPGMDKETLENCFQPYFSKKAAGTGLGLPIVKKIIEAHGGAVEIELPPSGGTVFNISLPV